MKNKSIMILVIIVVCFTSQQVFGNDDVLDVIKEAVKQYKEKDFVGAASNLDYASQLVRQKKSEKMKELLPKPLEGWQAQAANAQAVGAAIFGGGVTVFREYQKDSSLVTIEIISDSPVLQSVLMMLNNPMFAGAGGGRLETVNGQRAIIKYNPDTRLGDINFILSGRFVITVKGQDVGRDDLLSYANKIDFKIFSDK